MADRSTFNGASSEVPWKNTAGVPEGFGDQYARHIKALYDASALPLTAVAGTAANVTAQVDPTIAGGLVDGMKFTITWAADSTGPTTLKIGALAAAPVVDASGGALIAGSVKAGQRSLLEFVGGSFRLLGGASGSGMQGRFYSQFTASGTWTKPAGLDLDTMVLIEVWGGGGGGHGNGGGGGGGGYNRRWLRAADVPSSVAVTIGAGGTGGAQGANNGAAGGTTSFGALLSATGGQEGATSTGGAGGGLGSRWLGASGGTGGLDGSAATNDYGGAGGGAPHTGGGGGAGPSGGRSLYGGAGGGGGNPATTAGSRAPGGVSEFGGDGGDGGRNRADTRATAGQAPGGGGGGSGGNGPGGNGARGEARIWIL